jgi:flavin-dependent dehydrogenase
MKNDQNESLGPLQNNATAVVIGGGPGGAGCAIALKRLARALGRNIEVVLYEAKTFSGQPHYNQCIGVLSPPAERILDEQLGIPFPRHLIQRPITGYTLHTAERQIVLDGPGEISYALRRVQFDDYLLEQAKLQGVKVIHSRVTDLEFHSDRVVVFSESDNRQAAVVIGASGLDDGTLRMMSRSLPYRPPASLTTIVTKIHPGEPAMEAFGNRIHAFLLSGLQIEFGAITPKGNHLSINIAGQNVNVAVMEAFLRAKAVQAVLPRDQDAPEYNNLSYFKGRFPISVAKGFFGERYVLVGDAAGLVRAFKGKGINSACLSGLWAAEVILKHGVSREAFAIHYRRACQEILSDLPYGRAVRRLVALGRRLGLTDWAFSAAEKEPVLQSALFDAVSGHQPYRAIFLSLCDTSVLGRACKRLLHIGHRGGVSAT